MPNLSQFSWQSLIILQLTGLTSETVVQQESDIHIMDMDSWIDMDLIETCVCCSTSPNEHITIFQLYSSIYHVLDTIMYHLTPSMS